MPMDSLGISFTWNCALDVEQRDKCEWSGTISPSQWYCEHIVEILFYLLTAQEEMVSVTD